MNKLKRAVLTTPIIGSILLLLYRIKIGLSYFSSQLAKFITWLFRSRETTNFTYDLETANKKYLASLIAYTVNIEYSTALAYIDEIENDKELQKHITDATQKSDFAFKSDKKARFGKRMGWYAFTRALKPRVVIETGVDKGLGSCVLASALKRNKEEGFDGQYYGTDINPNAGFLFSGKYANCGQILYGDSIESLNKYDGVIDLFINDSDHSADYEAAEYRIIANKLSENAIILGDNSHVTDKLFTFSMENNRHFIFFPEKPLHHWYPGGGIGISFK